MKKELPDLQIHEYGDDSAPPVLFIGGWGVSTESYKERLENLAQAFKVYSISLPGFGDNEPLSVFSNHIIGQSEYIRFKVEKIVGNYDSIFLMGHSTGAAIATFLATYFPEKVKRLVLVSPIGSPDPLSKSFIRMLKVINIKEVLKYNTAQYRKRAIANIRLGVDAKYIDLSPHIYRTIASGVPVDIFISREDKIAPPGKLADIDTASVYWIDGGHAWFKHDRTVILEHLRRNIPHTEEEVSKPVRSNWLKFIDSVLTGFRKFVS